MALERFDNVYEIGGVKVLRNLTEGNGEKAVYEIDGERGECEWKDFSVVREKAPIGIHNGSNMISLKIQNGPIKEVGVNGCQMVTLARVFLTWLYDLKAEGKYHCDENQEQIDYLEKVIDADERRTARREREGSEGYNREREDA